MCNTRGLEGNCGCLVMLVTLGGVSVVDSRGLSVAWVFRSVLPQVSQAFWGALGCPSLELSLALVSDAGGWPQTGNGPVQ